MELITLKSPREQDAMRRAGRITAQARALAGSMVRPGVTTKEIDDAVRRFIRGKGGQKSRKGSAKGLIHEFFALGGMKFLSGNQGCDSAFLVLENAFVTKLFQHCICSGLLPAQLFSADFDQLPGGQRLMLPDNVRKM
jgi:hypothetical protein